jgi:methyltransferase
MSSTALRAFLVLVVVMLTMLAEALVSRRREIALRKQGAIEPPDDVYATMRWAYPTAFVTMGVEGMLFGPAATPLAVGVLLMLAAKGLKWWAIASLGPRWTFRVLIVPGAPLVTRGPYAFVRHPNYVGVVGELVAMALMVGARVSGPVATVLFSWLLLRRIRVEDRALRYPTCT